MTDGRAFLNFGRVAGPPERPYLHGVSLLPHSLRGRAPSLDADPFSYLRGILAFLLGGGAVVALLLALTGLAPGALLLAGVLWTMFGILSGMVDWILEPLVDLAGTVLTNVGLVRVRQSFSAEETLVAQGHADAAAEAYRLRAEDARDRVSATLRRAALLAGPLEVPHVAAGELEALQRDADQFSAADDMRIGLALTELYEQRLHDPGRAMVEVRRLLDRHPEARQARELRGLLAALRRDHFPGTRP